MSRYIDADAVIKRIQDEHKFGSLMLSNMIAEMPTVEDIDSAYAHGFTDAESKLLPKHGEWIYLYEDNYKCSICGSWWCCTDSQIDEMNYCPNCGAEMRGGKKWSTM